MELFRKRRELLCGRLLHDWIMGKLRAFILWTLLQMYRNVVLDVS